MSDRRVVKLSAGWTPKVVRMVDRVSSCVDVDLLLYGVDGHRMRGFLPIREYTVHLSQVVGLGIQIRIPRRLVRMSRPVMPGFWMSGYDRSNGVQWPDSSRFERVIGAPGFVNYAPMIHAAIKEIGDASGAVNG